MVLKTPFIMQLSQFNPPPFPSSLPDINLKALDRAEGPVQRFRALLTTLINMLIPPPPQKKNLTHSFGNNAFVLTFLIFIIFITMSKLSNITNQDGYVTLCKERSFDNIKHRWRY